MLKSSSAAVDRTFVQELPPLEFAAGTVFEFV